MLIVNRYTFFINLILDFFTICLIDLFAIFHIVHMSYVYNIIFKIHVYLRVQLKYRL